MRFLLFFIGFMPLAAHALDMPAYDAPLSPYVAAVLLETKNRVATQPEGSTGTCTEIQTKMLVEETANVFAELLNVPPESVAEMNNDYLLSACYADDVRIMENVLAGLIRSAMKSAEQCKPEAISTYRGTADFLWEKIWQVRRHGLDPSVRAPVGPSAFTGTGIPVGALPSDDDALCPYTSSYAPIGIGGTGCADNPFYSPSTLVLRDEASILSKIIARIGNGTAGLIGESELYRAKLHEVRSFSEAAVWIFSSIRPPKPFTLVEPAISLFVAATAGESGCEGWPSDVGGTVRGSEAQRFNAYTDILTQDLAEAMTYIRMRADPKWLEYINALDAEIEENENGYFGYTFHHDQFDQINRDHVAHETELILSIRDPQRRMENLANRLHARTLQFAKQATWLHAEGSKINSLPPLRDFILRLTQFMSGMCVNRGCQSVLDRTLELTLRDECFPVFTAKDASIGGAGFDTLPACRAKFTGP